jgi:chemotaxis protein MotA
MSKPAIDKGTLFGILLSLSGVAAGLWLEGGSATQILQPTAALIVLGGTLGAVMIQFPFETVREALAQIRHTLFHSSPITPQFIEEIVSCCTQVRRFGWLILDNRLDQIQDPFLRKCLTLGVDNVGIERLRAAMEIDLDLAEEHDEGVTGVLLAAGGFAPTLGIIGAVLGLIQVMQKMDNLGEIGKGIAVAFVSTLYGIGLANLCFLPLAGKLKIRMRQRQLMREMTLEAVISMLEGISPRALRERLQSYAASGTVHKAQDQPQAAAELLPS